jgi:alpha-tubulin suppressor-like RCC1 family protein
VSEGGAVTAVAPGDATITAKVTSVNGAEFSGTCAVTVEKSIVFPTFAAGGFHSLAIKTDGSLWAWGGNGNGQLGGLVESWDYWYVPNRVDDGDDWIGVWAGIYSSMAIKTDGSLWAWGNNWFGMLGYGHDENRTVPTRVGEDSNWASVAPGVYHTMAIKTDGSLWGAGVNWYGQLGVGEDYEDQHAFKRVGDENDWVAVAVGNAHTLALKKNGSLWAWGSNWTCQLGNGTGQNENVPIRVDEGTDWVFVAAGGESSLAIKSDGSLWAWGTNQYGVLGIGDDEFSNFPAHVGNGYAAAAIGCNYHTIAVKTDGSLWASGANWHGELGIGESHPFDFERHTFTQVGTAGGWAAVTAGDIHSLAIKTDGSLWAWGDNEFGTLGLGDTNLRDTPAEVGTGFRAP